MFNYIVSTNQTRLHIPLPSRGDIEKLPAQESPEIFGLHPNADLTFRTLQVQNMVATVVSTMPKTGGGDGGQSPSEIVDTIAKDLLQKVPAAFMAEITKEKLKKLPGGPTQPLTVHLRQEVDRLNVMLGRDVQPALVIGRHYISERDSAPVQYNDIA